MRPFALPTILLTLAAIGLGLFTLLVGIKPNSYSEYYIVLLDTSQIGQKLGKSNALAHQIGVADFYNLYVIDYCEGNYDPENAQPGVDVSLDVTYCSGTFSKTTPSQAIQRDLDRVGSDITLSDLGYDTSIDDKFHILYAALTAVIVFYAFGIFLSIVTLFCATLWFLKSYGRGWTVAATITGLVAAVCQLICSVVLTVVMSVGANAINGDGAGLGISANRGNKLLAVTWAGSACAMLAFLSALVGICVARRRERRVKGVDYE